MMMHGRTLVRRFTLCLIVVLSCWLILYPDLSLKAGTAAQTETTDSQIAFVSDRNGVPQVYVMDTNGSAVSLVSWDANVDRIPSWSPDGRSLLYSSNYWSGILCCPITGGLLLHDLIADVVQPIPSSATLDDTWPESTGAVFSPDGRQIAFYSDRDGDYDIYSMNADGTALQNLTNANAGNDGYPNWSPDGSRIAFSSYRDSQEDADIFIMESDGSNWVNLSNHPGDDFAPAWSPDGLSLAFTSGRDGNKEIYLMDSSGGHQVNLTHNPADDEKPTWSPDGRQIAFTTSRDGNGEIYVMRSDGSGLTNLSENPANEIEPAWSPFLTYETVATHTPTATQAPPTPSATPISCENAPPSRLTVGMQAYVAMPLAEGDERRNLRVRNEPDGAVVGMLEPGDEFIIVGEAVCSGDGLLWWEIETADGSLRGWSVEGFAPDDYLMVPIP